MELSNEKIYLPIHELPWSKCCATIIDKFGVCWWIFMETQAKTLAEQANRLPNRVAPNILQQTYILFVRDMHNKIGIC